jgi:hypothetical protein
MHNSVIKVLMSLRITTRQQKELHRISRREGVHVSELVRQGIDLAIERWKQVEYQPAHRA